MKQTLVALGRCNEKGMLETKGTHICFFLNMQKIIPVPIERAEAIANDILNWTKKEE